MSQIKGRPTEVMPPHRVLREVYRHYLEFQDYVSATGNHVIHHGYSVYEDDGETVKEKVSISISFWDLHNALDKLSDRKREAFYHNVILDKRQRDVADEMGITTVSVGQYVEQSCLQLAQNYYSAEELERHKKKESNGVRDLQSP